MRELHQKVDSLPEHAGVWKEKSLFFPDKPDDTFIIHYHDPVEAIKTLLGDPAFAQDIVYKPQKIFNKENQSRIRNEMWTGRWWSAMQVSMKTKFEANL